MSPGAAFEALHEAHEIATALSERQLNKPDIATDLSVSLLLLADLVDDPMPLLQERARSLKNEGIAS